MRSGREFARSRGVTVKRGERVSRFGDGWLIADRAGFKPCPWAFEVAEFSPAAQADRVLDLGTGTGALLVALNQVYPSLGECVGLELDPNTADQAQRNLTLLGVDDFTVEVCDLRVASSTQGFDLVVANPPFYPSGWGRVSEDSAKARATHALYGDVNDFAEVAARSVKPDGNVVFVFDGGRVRDVLVAFSRARLVTHAIRFLEDDRGQYARVLVLGGPTGDGVMVERRAYTDQIVAAAKDRPGQD